MATHVKNCHEKKDTECVFSLKLELSVNMTNTLKIAIGSSVYPRAHSSADCKQNRKKITSQTSTVHFKLQTSKTIEVVRSITCVTLVSQPYCDSGIQSDPSPAHSHFIYGDVKK